MLKTNPAPLACLASALALMSCAAPKAIVVTEVPVPETEKQEDPALVSEPDVPTIPDDGIRLPDMLTLPDDGELRSAASLPGGGSSGSGAVIARPPAELPKKP